MQSFSLFLCAVSVLTSTINAARITQNIKHIRSEPSEANKTTIYSQSKPVLSASNLSHTSQDWLATPPASNPIVREPLPAKANATHIGNSYSEGQITGYKAFLSHPSTNASAPTHLYTEDKTFNRGLVRGYRAGMNHRASANSSDLSASGSEQYMNGQLAGYRAALNQKVSNHARVSKQEFPTSILQHDVVFNAGARAGFEAGANSHFSRAHSGHSSHEELSREKSDASHKLVSHSEKHEKGTGSSAKEASRVHEVSSISGHDEHSSVKQAHHHHVTGEKHDVQAAAEQPSAPNNQTQRLATDANTKPEKATHKHEGHRVSHPSAAGASRTVEKPKKTNDQNNAAQFFAGRQVGMDASTRFPNSQPSAYFKTDPSFNAGVQAGFEANVQSHSPQ
ncbi:uncharacterized protein MELLADRAFT_105877 [Melampsora larici-populina 98AG31]|uniref:Secreted protein n=1 Tax=Melampsora larici-populina (strain 98AG31 / pathotype 3-4-7) TaxID=747676 RepID=F4RJM1_MELLP|nr:uncharacterized protein MELLADRAFT_105877 [Melampsora larici-populina 98AG31]EGG07330.1 hypothetical protein MELLADRAFT_105877 [Melampsora larici-populina 98AG31]